MVAFATIFLGLVLGSQIVELEIDGPVAAVEIRLDGETVAVRDAPPWTFVVDFGTAYEPHILEAVTFDAEGRPLSRAEQWLNVPRREVEADIVLGEGAAGSGVVARVVWESRVEALPEAVSATFDGRPIEAADPERIVLPDHDPEQLHLLQVELRFRGNHSALVEKTFGGAFTDEVETRLTAVPITLPARGKPPTAAELEDLFTDADGQALEVVAVDQGPAELYIVRDAAAQELLDKMVASRANRTRYRQAGPGRVEAITAPLRHTGQLRRGQIAYFLYPMTVEILGHRTLQEQFPTSRPYPAADGGLAWLMTKEKRAVEPHRQRLAEAVAVAGMAAATRNRRRAVLLVLRGDPADVSRIAPEVARRYLATIGVPLVVWTLDNAGTDGPWGPQRRIRGLADLHTATHALGRALDRQRVVWLQGRHLPQSIRLRQPAPFALAR